MKLTLNLATRNYVDRRKVNVAYGALLAFFGIILVVNVIEVIHTQMQKRTVRGYLQEVDLASADQPAADPAEVERLRQQIVFANDILARESFRWTELLNHLEEVLRQGVTIQSLRPDYRDGSLRVAGTARNLADMRSFIGRIQSSSHFETVFLFEQDRVEIESPWGAKKTALSFSLQLKGAF